MFVVLTILNLTIYFFLQKKNFSFPFYGRIICIIWFCNFCLYRYNIALYYVWVCVYFSDVHQKNYECWLCITIRKIWKNTKLDKWTREHSVNKFSKMNNRKMPLKFKHNFVWYFTTFGISFWHKFRFNDFYDRI